VDYRDRANETHAHLLRGKLFLIHGELDDNVTPYLTLRLAEALIESNKDFDLLIVPKSDHLLLVHQGYWLRRRWDYFVRNLLDLEPPMFAVTDIPLGENDPVRRIVGE